jgi:hypothetical protein
LLDATQGAPAAESQPGEEIGVESAGHRSPGALVEHAVFRHKSHNLDP